MLNHLPAAIDPNNFLTPQVLTTLADYGIRVGGAVALIIAAWLMSAWTRRSLRNTLGKSAVDATLVKFTSNAARWTILIGTGVSLLGIFGIQVASFAAILGAAGFAVGLAFQGTLSNFASGVMLLVFRPFKVGDSIKVSGQIGKVDEIDLFTTTLDTSDNRRIIMPNSVIFGATIENTSHHAARRLDMDVSFDGAIDIALIRSELEICISGIQSPANAPLAKAILVNASHDRSDFQIQIWVKSSDIDATREQVAIKLRSALNRTKSSLGTPNTTVINLPKDAIKEQTTTVTLNH